MTIEEAIREMEYFCRSTKFKTSQEAYRMAIAALRAKSANDEQTKSDGWISVKDRLPAPFMDVLIYTDKNRGEPDIGLYSTNGNAPHWVVAGALFIYNVTHWMPLPEPPGRDTT